MIKKLTTPKLLFLFLGIFDFFSLIATILIAFSKEKVIPFYQVGGMLLMISLVIVCIYLYFSIDTYSTAIKNTFIKYFIMFKLIATPVFLTIATIFCYNSELLNINNSLILILSLVVSTLTSLRIEKMLQAESL